MNTKSKLQSVKFEVKVMIKRLPDSVLIDIKRMNVEIGDMVEREIGLRAKNDEQCGGT